MNTDQMVTLKSIKNITGKYIVLLFTSGSTKNPATNHFVVRCKIKKVPCQILSLDKKNQTIMVKRIDRSRDKSEHTFKCSIDQEIRIFDDKETCLKRAKELY